MATMMSEKEKNQAEQVEYVDTTTEVINLSSIAVAAAASKAAWLISLTVSIGGFLFGYDTGYI